MVVRFRGGQKYQGGLHVLPVKGGSQTFESYDYISITAWLILFVGFLTNLLTWNTNNRNLLLATLVFLWTSFAVQAYVRWSFFLDAWIPMGLLLASAILVTLSYASNSQTASNIAVFLEIGALMMNSF